MYEQRYYHSKTTQYQDVLVATTPTAGAWPSETCDTPTSPAAHAKASRRDQTQTTPRTNYMVDNAGYQASPGLKVSVDYNSSLHVSPAPVADAVGGSTGLTPMASQMRLGERGFSPTVLQHDNPLSGMPLAYGTSAPSFQQNQQQAPMFQPTYQQQQQHYSEDQAAAVGYITGPLGAGVATLHGINTASTAAAAAPVASNFTPWNPPWPYAVENAALANAAFQQQQQQLYTQGQQQQQQQQNQQLPQPRPGHVTSRYTQPAVVIQQSRQDPSWPYLPGYAVVENTAPAQHHVQTQPPVQQVLHRSNEPSPVKTGPLEQQQQRQPATHSYSLRSAAKAAAAAATKAATAVVNSATTTTITNKTNKEPTSPAATSPVTPLPQQNQAQAKDKYLPLRRGMNPATVLRSLGHVLTSYEKSEVLGYPEIWFVGRVSTPKIRGSVNSGLPNCGYDDNRGEYQATPGDHIAYRYEIVSLLGQGSFGQVLKCVDHGTGSAIALKIIRNKRRFQRQAQVEAAILSTLSSSDPHDQAGIVRILDSFTFRSHLCITFELLGTNLYEHIKAAGFIGMPLPSVRHVAVQVLNTLVYLRGFNIVHCDLKPENILLVDSTSSANAAGGGGRGGRGNNNNNISGSCSIKVIDFGSSCYADQRVFTYIQSRFYRAPEVILGMAYGQAIDVWSLACVLAELVTGTPLFPGEHEAEQMACICEVLGLPPPSLIRESPRGKLFFDIQTGAALPIKPNSQGKVHRVGSQTLIGALNGRGDSLFLDFLRRCLQWDPERRLTAHQALQHPWIAGMTANVQEQQQQPRLGPLGGAAAALGLWR